jgi:MFS family permease
MQTEVIDDKNVVVEKMQHLGLALLVFTLAALFYLYEFILQVSPAVMTAGMMRDFEVHAAGLGIISAAYYYSYTPMQIPAGMLYDRFGPRALLTIAVVLCVLGSVFFGLTESRWFAALGRVFMGIGSAFSFIGVLILVSRWFSPKYFAFMVGIAQALSSVGAIIGESPLAYSVSHIGWRYTMFVLAAIGMILALFIWITVRDHPPGSQVEDTSEVSRQGEIEKLMRVCRNPQTWYLGLYAFFVWAPIVVFAGLWGVMYLENVYHISVEQASGMVSLVWIGIGVGSCSLGWWTDVVLQRCLPIKVAALIGVIAGGILIFHPNIPYWLMMVVLFFYGFAAAGQSISFAIVKDINFEENLGTASGFNNMATVAGGMCIQPLVGVFLAMLWRGQYLDGVPFYDVETIQKALIICPICYLFAWILGCLFIQETNCENQAIKNLDKHKQGL